MSTKKTMIVLHSLLILLLIFHNVLHIRCIKEEIVIDTNTNGLIAAFGDFDSDRFTDVFYITDKGKSFAMIKSYEQKPELRQSSNINCSFAGHKDLIAAVIPGDFDGDAKMDVLVVTQQKNENERHEFNIWFFKGDRGKLDCKIDNPIVKKAISQPMVLDYNGDMIQDFIVETSDSKCKRKLWSFSTDKKTFKSECLNVFNNGNGDNVQEMKFPNSNAFVNINNCRDKNVVDFSTDIVITGRNTIEYWMDSQGFKPVNKIDIPYPGGENHGTRYKMIGQSAFMDMNIDRCMEHLLPVCKSNDGVMNSLLHRVPPCEPQILWYDIQGTKEWIILSDFGNRTDLYFDRIISNFGYELPLTARYGDVDGDGYTDLLLIMKSKDGKNRAVVLQNIKDPNNDKRRKFVFFWSSEEQIKEDVEIASFLDVQENGKVDIILTTKRDNANMDNYNIWWIRNTFMESKCFLKVLVASGLCDGICPPDKGPYGSNTAGPFICYETSDVNGKLINGCDSQMTQSNHFALQLPYSIFGLGETPNFVETVFASIPSGEMKLRRSKWTQIVPDAQVVLIPYPANDTHYWISKLYYTPSPLIYSTLATLAVICFVLLIIILILHRKETLEDISEHEEYKRHWPESR